MTREHWKKLLPIITAFANGECVELYNSADAEWVSMEELNFNSTADKYRVKPKPREFKAWLHYICNHVLTLDMSEYNGWKPITVIEKK